MYIHARVVGYCITPFTGLPFTGMHHPPFLRKVREVKCGSSHLPQFSCEKQHNAGHIYYTYLKCVVSGMCSETFQICLVGGGGGLGTDYLHPLSRFTIY